MLDINLFREDKGGNPEMIRESQRKRFADVELVDKVIALDSEWRKLQWQREQYKKDKGLVSKEVGKRKKAKENADDLIAKSKEFDKLIEEADKLAEEKAKERDHTQGLIGNLVHEKTPVHNDEDEGNRVERTWGTPRDEPWLRNHVDLMTMIDGMDTRKGADVSGNRGYFLKGWGVMLNLALVQYGLSFLRARGYETLSTPFFMRQSQMKAVAQLDQFDEELYKCTGEGEDKYLIATSEQPIAAYHRGDWIDGKDLPMKYAGFSTCFRKEAGSHGRDTLGIFRVHQFEKVEQFCVTSPEDNASWNMFEEMIKNSEEFYQSLEIPYRVVNICSGALNNAAAQKLDLEASFPSSKAFRELVSCSNCTDYQARRLETRFGKTKKMGEREKKYVHMLNATLCATERALCCVVENYQTEEGVRVPEVLQKYVGTDFIPFTQPPPVFEETAPSKSK
eukprot:Rmarinus@m.12141